MFGKDYKLGGGGVSLGVGPGEAVCLRFQKTHTISSVSLSALQIKM